MRCDRFRRGYEALARHGLHFELQTPFRHLPDAAELARDFPETLIVVNHTGLPGSREPAVLEAWRKALEHVAAEPNVRLKVGGLGVAGAAWTVEAQRSVVLAALELFGPERCMFASNYPVDGLFRDLRGILDDFFDITAALPETARRDFFSGTAARTYGLTLP